MLFQVLGRDEAFTTALALVARLEHMYLRFHVPVQVRLGHTLVVAQLAAELADTWDKDR